jgi:polyferredoxin
MNFVSPYLIIDGSARGVITGSFLVFALMFASAIFLGRLWCAWVCPGAGLMEAAFMVNNRPAPGGRLNWIKLKGQPCLSNTPFSDFCSTGRSPATT